MLASCSECSSGRPAFNPKSSHTKNSKIVLDAALLNTQYLNYSACLGSGIIVRWYTRILVRIGYDNHYLS